MLIVDLLIATTFANAVANSGVVSLPFRKSSIISDADTLKKRDSQFAVEAQNIGLGYYVDIAVGTPPQNMSVFLDTGSSDLWLTGPGNEQCSNGFDCSSISTFDSSKSSTFKAQGIDFKINYLDYTYASGILGSDTLTMGPVTLKDAQFAVATDFNASDSILGIGYPAGESTTKDKKQHVYDNLPQALKKAGTIDTVAYSLYLDDADANHGTILFGGVDSSKYTGDLITVAVVPNLMLMGTPNITSFFIELTSVDWSYNDNEVFNLANGSVPAVLDSGAAMTRLPTFVAETLMNTFGGTYNDTLGGTYVLCKDGEVGGTIDFKFNSQTIKVPLSEMFVPVLNSSGDSVVDGNGNDLCYLGIIPSDELVLLGDTFLRSAYVVYNLDKDEISIAQANWSSGESKIEAIGSSGVPSATADKSATLKYFFSGLYGTTTDIAPSALAKLTTTSSVSSSVSQSTSSSTGMAASSTGSASSSAASSSAAITSPRLYNSAASWNPALAWFATAFFGVLAVILF